MGLMDRLLGRGLVRSDPQITLAQYSSFLNPWDWTTLGYNGNNFLVGGLNQTIPGSKQEDIDSTYESFVRQAYRANSVIFACMDAHRRLFAEVRFQFRQMVKGRPGDLFGNADLGILEKPWPNGTTGDLLTKAIQDVDLAGNFFAARRGSRIKRMRPDWVTIVLGLDGDPSVTSNDIDAEILGYIYHPGGKYSQNKPVPLLAEEVAHFAPISDPTASFRGMSWLTPLVREIMADSAATAHKLRFFENGATPNMVVKRNDPIGKDAFLEWVRTMEEGHAGVFNAYKTLYLTAGADATVVGSNLQQLDFKLTQGAGETRIAAAAGVPPIIVGLSEGLQAATYSNYGQARRAYADLWARPMWRNVAGSLATIVNVPQGAALWYDDRDIPFLAEDQKDRADIQQVKANTIRSLVDTGFKADAVIAAVESEDMGRLTGQHTGLFSVQLQAPGSLKMPAGEVPGETPVGPGTKPETLPAGDTSTKPVTGGKPTANAPRMFIDISFSELRELLAEGWTAATPVDDEIIRRAFTRVHGPETIVRTVDAPVPAPAPTNGKRDDALLTLLAAAVRQQPANITVNPPDVHVESPVTIEQGAFQAHIATPDVRIDAPVTIEEGALRVESPVFVEPAHVTIEDGAVRVENTIEPPSVTFEDGAMRTEITSPPAEITVNVPEQSPPEVNVTVEQPVRHKVTKDVTHDDKGRITRVVETED